MRNAVAGHSVGLGAGLASLWLTGSWHVADAFHTSTLSHAFASAIAVVLTVGVLTASGVHHAPAASTTVLVATGLAEPGRPLALQSAEGERRQLNRERQPADMLPEF